MTSQKYTFDPASEVIETDPLTGAEETLHNARVSGSVNGNTEQAQGGKPGAPSETVASGVPAENQACVSRQDPLTDSAEATLHDAWITGADSPEWQTLLDRPMTFLLPKNVFQDARQTEWKNTTGSFRDWLEGKNALSCHSVRKKKGYGPIVFGASAEVNGFTARKAAGMRTIDMIGIDVDSGDSYVEAVARVSSLGLACIAYTSYRDGITRTQEKRDKVLKKLGLDRTPTSSEMRAYFAGRLHDTVLKTLEVVGEEQNADGFHIVLEHAPLEKFRILIPLEQSLDIYSLAPTQWAAQARYKAMVKALAAWIGVTPDAACFDVARVFYMPSRPPGGDFALDVIRGRGLRLEDIPDVADDVNTSAKAGTDADDSEIAGLPARTWAAKYGKRLEIVRLLEDECPDHVRATKGGILVVECPYDEDHGNAGDTTDTACHVRDADGDTGFIWACKHNSCADRDRLEMVKKAVADGWFDASLLTDEGYLVPLSDEELEADEVEMPPAARNAERFEPLKQCLPSGYTLKSGMIWATIGDEETPLCQRFDVIGRASNLAGNADAGRIISFQNENGVEVEITLNMANLIRENGGGVIEELADAGMSLMISGRKSREALLLLFRMLKAQRHIPTVPRAGWVQDRGGNLAGFMCPTGEYVPTATGAPYRLATGSTVSDPAPMGTLEGWKGAADAAFANIGDAAPNFFWVLSVAGGFVGPLMALADVDGCGFNLSGESSKGKSLALTLAASVWATPRDKKGVFFGMSGTTNSIELVAARTSEAVYAMDEIGRMQNPETLGATLFNLASGSGRSRMRGRDVAAGLAEEADFRVFVIASNERSLRTVITGAGGDYKTGLSARFPDIDVTSGARVSAETIQRIEAVKAHFGHAGPAFVRWLIAEGWHRNGAELRKKIDAAAKVLAGDVNPAQVRAARVFALVQIAGELAVDAGLLPDAGKIAGAVKTAWETFIESDEGRATEGESSLLDGFKSWVVRNMGGAIIEAGYESPREVMGWHTLDQIILDWEAIKDVRKLGLSGTRTGLAKALEDCGALELSGKNRYHNSLLPPLSGRVKNLRIDRAKLGLKDLPKGTPA